MEKARYLIEMYKDDYDSLQQTIEIDLKEDERTDGQYSSFLRNKINPNLKTCFRKVYLNGNRKPIKELILVDDEWWDIKDIKKEQQVI